jgi:hypothetical protein
MFGERGREEILFSKTWTPKGKIGDKDYAGLDERYQHTR